ncbi:MAG: hypothetical protein CMJ19_09700, partial [Phycisphaeraceae bacterium]|nr:hypothetical protein [Phycisphaeraceae bacterium]
MLFPFEEQEIATDFRHGINVAEGDPTGQTIGKHFDLGTFLEIEAALPITVPEHGVVPVTWRHRTHPPSLRTP